MKILHAYATHLALPAKKYGGTERVIWSMAQAQMRAGHEVKFLARNAGELKDQTIIFDRDKPVNEQITDWPDVVHFHWPYEGELDKPFLSTEHGNGANGRTYPINTVFLSRNHAQNHGAECFVYNGLEWSEYGEPNITQPKDYFHFLAKAKAPTKNLKGTIALAKNTGNKLRILGGGRINLGRNRYFDTSLHTRFHGMVGGEDKHSLIRDSKGLLFPVRWHEPFGLAITESLFLGCPVIATPFGSLPELVSNEQVGFLSDSYSELAEAVNRIDEFDRKACHELARDVFNADIMARDYGRLYEKVINGESLNQQPPKSTFMQPGLLPIRD